VLFVSDWGFPLDRIRMPVELWYGEADHIVPPLHARLLAAALPDARLELVEGEGHYSLPIVRCEQVLG
jgi:pimeloyl-ACP methyl ester carboxylesterase